jgi:hypothetical protein
LLSPESPEPIAGPSHICITRVPVLIEDFETPENPAAVIFDPRASEIYPPPKLLEKKKQKNYKDNKSIKKNVLYKTHSVSQYGKQLK